MELVPSVLVDQEIQKKMYLLFDKISHLTLKDTVYTYPWCILNLGIFSPK